MDEKKAKSETTIRMVENALDVLELLLKSRFPLGVNEIAKKTNLSPSTAFRILTTLVVKGWAYKLSTDQYIAGEKCAFVTEKTNLYLALADSALFVMKEYTKEYNQAMNLMIRQYNECKIIQQSRTQNLVDYIPPIYTVLPIYACACGKVLLSELSISLAEEILNSCHMARITDHTITDKEEIWKTLREVASKGYALENQESSVNGSCIAVPVRDNRGNIIAALSFSGFIGMEKPEEQLTQYVSPLKKASDEISHAMYRFWNY